MYKKVVTLLPAIKLYFLFSIVMLCILPSAQTVPVYAPNGQDEALSSISNAKESMVQAYKTVLDAEQIGANISSLLDKLNYATGLLSEAKTAFEIGSFDEAVLHADMSTQIGREAENEAESLKAEASYARSNRTLWFTAGSVLGVSIVLFCSLLGYSYFRRRYYGRLLKMRPRVEQM